MDVHPTKNVSIGIDPYPYQLLIYYPLTSGIIPVTSSRWPLQKLRQRRSPLYDHPNGLYSLQNHMCHGHNMLDVVSSSDHHEGFRLMVISTYMYTCIYIYCLSCIYIYIVYHINIVYHITCIYIVYHVYNYIYTI